MKLRGAHLAPYILAVTALLFSTAPLAHPGAQASIAHYTQLIEKNPSKQSLYIQRGITYSSDGQYDSALADFEQATKLGDPVVVSFDLGVLQYRRGEAATARSYFNEYLKAFPNHIASLEYRARLLRDEGDQAGSIADFLRVFELQNRPNPGHYVSVAEMLKSSGPDGIGDALVILDAGNAKLGLTPQLQYQAIQLELQRNRPDLAVERMQSLEPMLGDSPDWKVQMAELRLKSGETEQASQLLQEAAKQLQTLRKTPARLDLQQRITLLEAQLFSSSLI